MRTYELQENEKPLISKASTITTPSTIEDSCHCENRSSSIRSGRENLNERL